jgi:hypothetical protein
LWGGEYLRSGYGEGIGCQSQKADCVVRGHIKVDGKWTTRYNNKRIKQVLQLELIPTGPRGDVWDDMFITQDHS